MLGFSYVLNSVLPTSISQFFGLAPKNLSKTEMFFDKVSSYTLYGLLLHSSSCYFKGLGQVAGHALDTLSDFMPTQVIDLHGVGLIFRDDDVCKKAIGMELAFLTLQYGGKSLDHFVGDLLNLNESNGLYIARSTILGASIGKLISIDKDSAIYHYCADGIDQNSIMSLIGITATAGFLTGVLLSLYSWYSYEPVVEEKGFVENAQDKVFYCVDGMKNTSSEYLESAKNHFFNFGHSLTDWYYTE